MRAIRPLASEPSAPCGSPYLNAKEAAAFLKFGSVESLYKALRNPNIGIPCRRRGRTLLFLPSELDRWMAGESRLSLLREARRAHGSTVDRRRDEGNGNSVAGNGLLR